MPKTNELRPSHYKEGEDTFAWAEKRFTVDQLEAIAEFNIHKYFNRKKGQDVKDFGKIANYSLWIAGILDKKAANDQSEGLRNSIHHEDAFHRR